jgi:hypothetical protein
MPARHSKLSTILFAVRKIEMAASKGAFDSTAVAKDYFELAADGGRQCSSRSGC